MLSVANLSKLLVDFGAARSTFTTDDVKAGRVRAFMAQGFGLGNETYGRSSFIYVYCPDVSTRRRLESFLMARTAKVSPNYNPGGCSSEIRVAYFKGFHWDE